MSGTDENAAESTPVLAIALAVIAFLGVSTTFIPADWLKGDASEKTTETKIVAQQTVAEKTSQQTNNATDAVETNTEQQNLPVVKQNDTDQATTASSASGIQVADDKTSTAQEAETRQAQPAAAKQPVQPASSMNFALPHPEIQWRPSHMASQHDNPGLPPMGAIQPGRPGYYPQPPQYPYAYPDPYKSEYNSGYYPPPMPYMPGRAKQ